MASIRQNKVSGLIQKELGQIFQLHARDLCLGSMITVTTVRVTADLSYAKIYLSIFGTQDRDAVFKNINLNKNIIKNDMAQKIKKQIRVIPELEFYIDDSLDYAQKIEELLTPKK